MCYVRGLFVIVGSSTFGLSLIWGEAKLVLLPAYKGNLTLFSFFFIQLFFFLLEVIGVPTPDVKYGGVLPDFKLRDLSVPIDPRKDIILRSVNDAVSRRLKAVNDCINGSVFKDSADPVSA